MANFKQIDEARKLLGLDEYSTLEEIKKTYRKLTYKYHPDKCRDEKKKECEEMFKKISHANNILMNYCAGYQLKRFYDGW